MAFLGDNLSIFMSMFVTFVGWLIHIYAVGYMKDDEGFGKFLLTLIYSSINVDSCTCRQSNNFIYRLGRCWSLFIPFNQILLW